MCLYETALIFLFFLFESPQKNRYWRTYFILNWIFYNIWTCYGTSDCTPLSVIIPFWKWSTQTTQTSAKVFHQPMEFFSKFLDRDGDPDNPIPPQPPPPCMTSNLFWKCYQSPLCNVANWQPNLYVSLALVIKITGFVSPCTIRPSYPGVNLT